MKTAVSTVFVGKKRDYNRRFQEMCTHHLVEPVACTPGAGWEKGQVERQVGDVRGRLFVPSPRGRSYAEINEWLMDRCIEDARKHPHPTIPGKTVWQVFEEERPFLTAYRGPFDGFHATEVAVSKTCLVRFDNNQYSVAARRQSPTMPKQKLSATSKVATATVIAVEIVRKSTDQVGFAVQPRRWVVERFFAWINRRPATGKGLRGHHRLGPRLPLRRLRHAPRPQIGPSRMTFETDS